MPVTAPSRPADRSNRFALALGIAGVVLFTWRAAFPERSLEATGWRAWSDAGFAVGLLVLVVLLAWSLGRTALRRFRSDVANDDPLTIVMEIGLGLGLLGLAILLFGLAGLFDARVFLALLIVALLVGRRSLGAVLESLARLPGRAVQSARQVGLLGIASLAGSLVIAAIAGLQALTPPWDYDGLMYHLQAPRLYLDAGRVFLTPDLWQANGPMLGEMLYGLGLAFGSDVFARLLHLVLAFVLAAAVAGVAARSCGARAGWIAFAVMVGIPIYPMWGQLAFADLFWALNEWLAVAALLVWTSERRDEWLIVAGVFTGFALGSKYLALGLAPLLLVWIVVHDRREGGRVILRDAARLVLPAVALSAPWFLKNLAWTGNPVYPFVFGGPGWDEARLSLLMAYLRSFGTGHGLMDYVMLPWNVYAQHVRFGTFMTTIELPGLLFPLAILAPFLHPGRATRPLAWLALGRFVVWALGSQQIRLLLPIFPVAGVLTAAVLDRLWEALGARPGLRVVVPGLLIGGLAATLAYQIIFLSNTRPLSVVAGAESKDAFLERAVYDYAALRYVRQALPRESRVAMLWDGQGYYCDDRCLPDADQSRWVQMVEAAPAIGAMTRALRDQRVTHLLLDVEGLNFLLRHDPSGAHERAAAFLLNTFAPECLTPLQRTPKVILYRLDCHDLSTGL
ncbi:MAG TPA: glycosyltransferase family 39 protein [Anaerolineales bacterium]|nr:glycosyltransferase family 39 protein [Anaerolineales bacterium]